MSAYNVAVVGAGAAGLAAAAVAAGAGASVILIDDGAAPGGELLLRPDVRAGQSVIGEQASGPDLARRLTEQATQAGVELRLATTAWALFPGPALHVSNADGAGEEIQAGRIVLATGATDAPLPFPGWTAPGVITARAARTLLHRHGVLPGRRALVAGSSPDAIALAVDLATTGVEVAAVIDAWPEPLASDAALAALETHGIALRTSTTIVGVDGPDGVRGVVLAHSDTIGNHTAAAATETLAVDVVVIAAGVVPEATLARMAGAATRYDAAAGTFMVAHDETMRASGTEFYVAGRVTGAPSVEAALAQGGLAGSCAAAAALGRQPVAETVARYRQEHEEAIQAARALRRTTTGAGHPLLRFLPGTGGDDVMICRCEDLSLGEVRAAIAAGARSQDAVKRRTRAGMGLCQGRFCGGVINALIAQETDGDVAALELMTARGPARPVPLSALTGPFAALDRPDEQRAPSA